MKRTAWVLIAAALLAACADERSPVSPSIPDRPSDLVSDGARGGNPDFFFLLPLALPPFNSPNFDPGQFDATRTPVVQVCKLVGGAIVDAAGDGLCDAPQAQFSGAQVTLQPYLQSYQALWRTNQPALTVGAVYRIRVLIANVELGFVDVERSSPSEFRNVLTRQNLPVLDGIILPIRFRIEKGVLALGDGATTEFVEAVVPAGGGTVTTPSSHAGAFFPDGWLAGVTVGGQPVTSVIVTIDRVATAADNNCHLGQPTPGLLQFEGCFQYRTIPDLGVNPFAKDVIVAVCPEIPTTDPRYGALRLYKSDVDEPVTLLARAVPPFPLVCAGFTGTPPQTASRTVLDRVGDRVRVAAAGIGRLLTPRSAFAVDLGAGGKLRGFSNIGLGIQRNIALTGAFPETALPGAIVPVAVRVTGTHEDHLPQPEEVPLPGQTVTFTVIGGGGSVPLTAVTDAQGIATVSWALGATPGTNTLVASVPGLAAPATTTVSIAAAATTTTFDFDAYPGNPDALIASGTDLQTAFANAGVTFARVGGTICGPSVYANNHGPVVTARYTFAFGTANNNVSVCAPNTASDFNQTEFGRAEARFATAASAVCIDVYATAANTGAVLEAFGPAGSLGLVTSVGAWGTPLCVRAAGITRVQFAGRGLVPDGPSRETAVFDNLVVTY